MSCKYFEPFNAICTNGECPARADVCPLFEQNDYQEICKYYEAEPTYCTEKQNKLVHCENCHEECEVD